MPGLVWLNRARRRLREGLVRQQVQSGKPAEMETVMRDLGDILKLAFPEAETVVVQDEYLGFRFRPGEHILLVEVPDADAAGNYVLKVKSQQKLEVEWNAWRDCLAAAPRHDLVFMTLRAVRDASQRLVALRYQDAQQFINVDQTMPLETAFLQCVTRGSPTPGSLANVLTELFARVGHLLYRGADAVLPVAADGNAIVVNDNKPLQEFLDKWNEPGVPQTARRLALAGVPLKEEGFYDPVDFFAFVLDQLSSGAAGRDYLPRMLRGRAHGDLHGRNVLLALVEDEAHWPALFDYEDMRTDNWLAWDFAKLETELKIRAYAKVFAGLKRLDFAHQVCRFENRLCEATEEHRREGNWPAPGGDSSRERLHSLLLAVRRQAGKHLGDVPGRAGEWLEELYFALASYGVGTGRYKNLQEVELLAALVSAGVAAARFAYSRDRRMGRDDQPAAAAPQSVEEVLSGKYPSYQVPVRQVRDWNREGDPQSLDNAELTACELKARYPHVLPLRYELAFSMVRQGRRAEAIAELDRAGREFPVLDEDCLCLLGRCHKEDGDALLEAGSLARAEQQYRVAEENYEQAYALREDRFPGINMAGLRLIRASLLKQLGDEPAPVGDGDSPADGLLERAQQLARQLIDNRRRWEKRLKDDNIWMLATAGEAHLILEQWDKAARCYRDALSQDNLQAYQPQSMKAQVLRLRAAFDRLAIKPRGPLADVESFFGNRTE